MSDSAMPTPWKTSEGLQGAGSGNPASKMFPEIGQLVSGVSI